MRRSSREKLAAVNRRGPSTEKLLEKTKGEVHAVPQDRRVRRSRVSAGMPTTEQQKKLAAEYLKDYDFIAAARRAGYTGDEDTIMRAFRAIAPYIREAQMAKAREMGKRIATSQERVLQELAAEAHYSEMDFVVIEDDVRDGKPVKVRRQKRLEELDDWQQMLVTDIKFHADGSASYRLPDRTEARKMIGRHLGMFNDKLIIANLSRQQLGDKVDLSNVPDDALERIEKELLRYAGAGAKRSLGDYTNEDHHEFDGKAGRVQ